MPKVLQCIIVYNKCIIVYNKNVDGTGNLSHIAVFRTGSTNKSWLMAVAMEGKPGLSLAPGVPEVGEGPDNDLRCPLNPAVIVILVIYTYMCRGLQGHYPTIKISNLIKGTPGEV